MKNSLDLNNCFVCSFTPTWKNWYCGLKGHCKQTKKDILYDSFTVRFYIDFHNFIEKINNCEEYLKND